MKKVIFMTVLMVFGLALFSGCASMTGRTAGEYIDDASITTEANGIIVKDPDAQKGNRGRFYFLSFSSLFGLSFLKSRKKGTGTLSDGKERIEIKNRRR